MADYAAEAGFVFPPQDARSIERPSGKNTREIPNREFDPRQLEGWRLSKPCKVVDGKVVPT